MAVGQARRGDCIELFFLAQIGDPSAPRLRGQPLKVRARVSLVVAFGLDPPAPWDVVVVALTAVHDVVAVAVTAVVNVNVDAVVVIAAAAAVTVAVVLTATGGDGAVAGVAANIVIIAAVPDDVVTVSVAAGGGLIAPDTVKAHVGYAQHEFAIIVCDISRMLDPQVPPFVEHGSSQELEVDYQSGCQGQLQVSQLGHSTLHRVRSVGLKLHSTVRVVRALRTRTGILRRGEAA